MSPKFPLRLSRKKSQQKLREGYAIRQTLLDFFQITFSHHPLPLQRAVSFRILRESAKRLRLPSEVARNVEGYAIRQTLLDFFQIICSHHPLPLQRAVSFTILRESAKRSGREVRDLVGPGPGGTKGKFGPKGTIHSLLGAEE